MRRIRRLLSWGITLALAVLPLILAPGARPIRDADPSTYLAAMCGGAPPEVFPYYVARSTGAYPASGDALYFYVQEHHSRPTIRVAKAAVVDRLDREGLPPTGPTAHPLCARWRTWGPWCNEKRARRCADVVDRTGSAERSIDLIHADALKQISERDLRVFDNALRGERFFPLTVAFECLFIFGWILFLRWPWLRHLSQRRKYAHLLAAPTLLFLPFFLGYAPMTFTFGPSGGIVYPAFIGLIGLPISFVPCTPVDRFVLQLLPYVLGSISQVPGPPMAATFYQCVGVTGTLTAGCAFAAIAAVADRSRRWARMTWQRSRTKCQ